MVKIALKDGTFRVLRSICQTTGYIGPYLEPVSDAMTEIVRLAKRRIPAAWKPAPIVVVVLEGKPFEEMLQKGKLPRVFCVGEFVAYRGTETTAKATYLHIVWFEDSLDTHISKENEMAIANIDWDQSTAQLSGE